MFCLKRTILIAVCVAVFASIVTGQGKAREIETLLTSYNELGQFNGAVLVAENNKVIYKKGFGLANFEWHIPNTADTKFRIGSITKSFTAVLLFQLIENGQLKLDGKVSEYLPEFPKTKGDKITINHLLTHRAGLRDVSDFPRSGSNFPAITAKINAGFVNTEELVKFIGEYDLLFEPGTAFRYSNDGYIVLGRIIEKITGKPFETVLKDNILTPFDMKNSGMAYPNNVLKNKAYGYDQTFYGFENAAQISVTSASGMYSTVDDLNLFSRALQTTKLIPENSKRIMFGVSTDVVYGWKVRKFKDDKGVEKTITITDGSLPGYTSIMLQEVEANRLFILLINTRQMTHRIGDIYSALSNILNGKPYSQPKRSVAEEIFKTLADGNTSDISLRFGKLKSNASYYLNEGEMNSAGYQFLHEGKLNEAITVLKLNTDAFPESSNAYDSLGEAYMIQGNKELAIKNYQRSVELNPQNTNGIEALKKLKGN